MAYSVVFKERGLPAGTIWSVTDGTSLTTQSTSRTLLDFSELKGLMPYSIEPPTGYGVLSVSPATDRGSLSVTGGELVTIQFGRPTTLTFQEHGLALGVPWSVSIESTLAGGPANQSATSSNGTISFSVISGPYRWQTGSSSSQFKPAHSHGGTGVGVAGKTVSIVFKELTSEVKFSERGLPRGTMWTVSIEGGPTLTSSGGSIVLHLPNGTFVYNITASNHAYVGSIINGSLRVATPTVIVIQTVFTDPPLASAAPQNPTTLVGYLLGRIELIPRGASL